MKGCAEGLFLLLLLLMMMMMLQGCCPPTGALADMQAAGLLCCKLVHLLLAQHC
jgi:hypothetical protein